MLIEINAKASWEHWPVDHLTIPACFYLAAKVDCPPLGFPCHGVVLSLRLSSSALKPKATGRTASMHELFLMLQGDLDCTAGFWQMQAFLASLY